MDDKIFRNISTDVLNRVKDKLNPDFVSELPASPEELLSFAKRRVDPVISDNNSDQMQKKSFKKIQLILAH